MLQNSNYTQVPNEILDNIDKLKPACLKVILAITRATLGWHERSKRMSITYLMKMTGLSNRSVISAAAELSDIGWVKRRKVAHERGETYEYELLLDPVKKVHGMDAEDCEPSSRPTSELGSQSPVNIVHSYKERDLKEIEKERVLFPKTEKEPAIAPLQNQNLRIEEVGGTATRLEPDEQAEILGVQEKKKGKKKTSKDLLDELSPEMKARFDKFWLGYQAYAVGKNSSPGSKKPAASAWVALVRSNFNGRGIDAFEVGNRLFLRQQGASEIGIPHACRFLFSAANGTGRWEDAIDREAACQAAKVDGTHGFKLEGEEGRGNAPPIYRAPDVQPEYSPPPANYIAIAGGRKKSA